MTAKSKITISRRTLLAGASGTLIVSRASWAQQSSEVKVGLLVPISGLYARPGTVMREGAEMAIDHINAQGGIKALGGAKLKLVVLDSGDTTEKARMPLSAWWRRRPIWSRPPVPIYHHSRSR